MTSERAADVAPPILLVDDHADSRDMLRVFLESEGFSVVEAANGKEALDLLMGPGKVPPPFIVLDLDMPVMGGWEFLAIIRVYQRFSNIPVVITSGSGRTTDAVKHRAAVAYLPKPVDLSRLAELAKRFARAESGPDCDEEAS